MKSEQTNKRLANRADILRTLHFEGPLQRSELSRICSIRKSSVTSITAELIEQELIRETAPGQYRSPLELAPNKYTALVANITPHNLSFARVDLHGKIILRRDICLADDNSPATVIPLITKNLTELQPEAPTLGIGIALPGIIDPYRGLCIQAVNLNHWHNTHLAEIIRENLNTDIVIDNDVRCQLNACTWFGHLARNAENVLYLFIHDGVSCALMSRGQIIIGERFTAGEIGHTKAGDEGRLCACGRLDCLETYCSLPAIIAEIKAVQPDIKIENATDITAAARSNPAVDNILDRVTNRLARSITGIVAATDPAALVLGTADSTFSESLRPHLRRHLYSEMIGLHSGDAKITTAGNSDTETLRGIAARVIRRSFRTTLQPNQDTNA